MVIELGALLERVTVHVAVAPELSDDGEQTKELSEAGANSEIEAVRETPLSDAVTTAVLFVVRVPAPAVKLAADCPALTATDAGIVSNVLLSDNVMVVAAETAREIVTVHVELPPETREAGEHASEVKVGGLLEAIWTTPPVAKT